MDGDARWSRGQQSRWSKIAWDRERVLSERRRRHANEQQPSESGNRVARLRIGRKRFGGHAPASSCLLRARDDARRHRLGLPVILVTDALCSSADETHDAMMDIYLNRFGEQVETVTIDTLLESWRGSARARKAS